MKDKSMAIFNVFGFSLLLIVVLYVGISIFLPVSVNSGKVSVIFDSLRSSVLDDVFNQDSSSKTSNFVRLSNLAIAAPSLRSLTVKDNKGKAIYIFSRNASSVNNDSNSGKVSVDQKRDFIKDKVINGFGEFNGRLYSLTAVFTLIDNKFILGIIRNGLILLGIYLFSTCLFLLITQNRRSQLEKVNSFEPSQSVIDQKNEMNNKKSSKIKSPGSTNFPVEKLTNELKRSAAFDQDLVLVLINLPQEFSDIFGQSFEKLLKESFTYTDLVFRFNDTSFGVILPNEDIDKGINHIKDFDKHSIEAIEQLNRIIVNYGLSSRNGRLIEGEVIFTEASAALKHAMREKDANIIAFRPDPAKYREFLANSDT